MDKSRIITYLRSIKVIKRYTTEGYRILTIAAEPNYQFLQTMKASTDTRKSFATKTRQASITNLTTTTSNQDNKKEEKTFQKAYARENEMDLNISSPKLENKVETSTLDMSFEDPKASFVSKTNWELIRGIMVHKLCSMEYFVTNNKKIMSFLRKTFGDTVFTWIMKLTLYGHFVAGEDEYQIKPVLDRLKQFGVNPILDYIVETELTSEKAKELEEKSIIGSVDDGKTNHLKKFQFDKRFADRRYKVQGARTYFYENEAMCERNMEYLIRSLDALNLHSDNGAGITSIKLTALGRPQLLVALSEAIVRTRQYFGNIMGGSGHIMTHHKTREQLENKFTAVKISDLKSNKKFLDEIETQNQEIIHLFPWSGFINEDCELSTTFKVPDLKTGHMVSLISKLTYKEEQMFRNMIRRVNIIVKTAEIMNAKVMFDAEHTYFQPAISRLACEFMRKYNKNKIVVYNTYQSYLKDSYSEVMADLEQAEVQNFHFGCKLCRGAYLDHERERAKAMGYEDPINPSYEITTKMFHDTLEACMKRATKYKELGKSNKIKIMVATHNEETLRFAITKMKETNIEPNEEIIYFGQLIGMCDYLTFPLDRAGYSVYKYVPYGPVLKVLPYLSRRAEQNKSISEKCEKEKRLLRAELIDRLRHGQIMYNPIEMRNKIQ